MKPAVGPLTTGTYVGHPVDHPGKYYGHKDVDGTKIGLVEDKEHEGIKWKLEKVGENRFKHRNSSSGAMASVNPADKTLQLGMTEEGTEWFIEPTDVDGEYTACPAHDKSLFVMSPNPGDANDLKLGPQSEMLKFNVYRVDDD